MADPRSRGKSSREGVRQDFVTRRAFLRGFGIASGAVAFPGVLAACMSDSATTTTLAGAPTTTGGGAGAPSGIPGAIYSALYPNLPYGGNAEIILEQVPDTLDHLATAAFATYFATDGVHDWLEHFDQNGELVPSLAESIEIVDDLTIVYTIRTGAFFHNGREVTADDVKSTFEWIQDPANASPQAGRVEGVTVEVRDAQTAVLKLDAPNAGLRANLTRVPIIPVEEADNQATAPVGCGPYIFDRWTQGSSVELVRNDNYWNPAAPRLDSVKVSFFGDTVAGLGAFLSGDADFIHSIPAARIPDFLDSGEYDPVIVAPGFTYLGINHAVEPFGDPAVRRAMALALDRPSLGQGPFNGIAEPYYGFGVPIESPYYYDEHVIERNVEEARSILQTAGYTDPITAELLTLEIDYFQGQAVIAQSNLQEIGIEVDIQVLDLSGVIDRTFVNKEYDLVTLGDSWDIEPSVFIDAYLSSDGDSNYFNYSNPDVDALLDQGRSTLDDDARVDIYRQALTKALIDDSAVIGMSTEPFLGLSKKGFNGLQFGKSPNERWHYPIAAKEG